MFPFRQTRSQTELSHPNARRNRSRWYASRSSGDILAKSGLSSGVGFCVAFDLGAVPLVGVAAGMLIVVPLPP